jgi:uncharacterized membrane protein
MNSDLQSQLNTIIQRPYSVDIGGFLQRGWQIFTQNPGGFIGYFVLSAIINFALANIPIVGGIASLFVSGALAAGFFFVCFKISRQQSSEFGDFFKGFQNTYYLPIFVANLLIGLILLLFMAVFIVGASLAIVSFIAKVDSTAAITALPIPESWTQFLLLVGTVLLIPAIYLGTAYSFAIPLIADKLVPPWLAMETSRKLISKQWFPFFGFTFVLGLINFAAILITCGLGMLLTGPLTVCAIAAAYESIVGVGATDR